MAEPRRSIQSFPVQDAFDAVYRVRVSRWKSALFRSGPEAGGRGEKLIRLNEGKPRFRACRNLAGQPGTLFLHEKRLPLRDAACELLDLLLLRSARFGPLRLGSGLLAGGTLQLLPFLYIFNLGGICH